MLRSKRLTAKRQAALLSAKNGASHHFWMFANTILLLIPILAAVTAAISTTESGLNDSWNMRDFSSLEPPNAPPASANAPGQPTLNADSRIFANGFPKSLQVHPTKFSRDFRLPQ